MQDEGANIAGARVFLHGCWEKRCPFQRDRRAIGSSRAGKLLERATDSVRDDRVLHFGVFAVFLTALAVTLATSSVT